jgi:uncharacterized Tic20 family protein
MEDTNSVPEVPPDNTTPVQPVPPAPELPPAAASIPVAPQTYAPQPLSPSDERTWAMLAHLSILLNLFTGFLGTLGALIIYLIFKDRSRYVAYQSMQAFIFQLIAFFGFGALATVAWVISGMLSVVLIGCLCMPIALLISLVPVAALVYGVIGAIECNQGRDFQYWLVGEWTRSILTGN